MGLSIRWGTGESTARIILDCSRWLKEIRLIWRIWLLIVWVRARRLKLLRRRKCLIDPNKILPYSWNSSNRNCKISTKSNRQGSALATDRISSPSAISGVGWKYWLILINGNEMQSTLSHTSGRYRLRTPVCCSRKLRGRSWRKI